MGPQDSPFALTQRRENLLRKRTMSLHHGELFGIELFMAVEDRVGDADLAHVVQLCGQFQHFHVGGAESQFAGDNPGIAAYPHHVLAGDVVPVFRRAGKAMDDFFPGGCQFRGPFADLLLQLLGVVGQAFLVSLRGQGVADAGNQIVRIDRLGKKIGRAQIQCVSLRFRVGGGGQDQHRESPGILIQSKRAKDVQPTHLRHHDVQQQEARLLPGDGLHGLGGIAEREKIRVAFVAKVLADDHHVVWLVVQDHDLGIHDRIPPRRGVRFLRQEAFDAGRHWCTGVRRLPQSASEERIRAICP